MAYTDRPTTFADAHFQHGQMLATGTTQLVAPTGYVIIAIVALSGSTVLTELSPENGADSLFIGNDTDENGAGSLPGASGGQLLNSTQFYQGVYIYGRWKSFTLSGGVALAYVRKA